jgi:hypothetical protein
MRMYLVGMAVTALSLTAGGAAQADPLVTAGIGLATCEKLAGDIKPEVGLEHLPNALLYYWVQGYMSAANITTLEGDSEYIDLSKYDEKVILSEVKKFCTEYPDKKPISLIDTMLEKAEKIKGEWKKGTIPWAAD